MNTYEGIIGKPVEKATSKAGTVYFRTRLADNFTKSGQKITTWHEVVLFGVPEEVINGVDKGMLVRIKGRQELGAYISKTTQLPVPVSTIIASSIEVLPKKTTSAPQEDNSIVSTVQKEDYDVPF